MKIVISLIALCLCGYQFYEIYRKNKENQESGKASPVSWYALIPIAGALIYFLFDKIFD